MIRIHKEGYTIIAIAMAIVISIIGAFKIFANPQSKDPFFLYLILIALLVLIVQFFRNPKRKTTLDGNIVVSPADGKVVVVEETTEQEFFKRPMKQVSIFMSPLNVHVNRYPVCGKVLYQKHSPGKYLVAWNPKSSHLNERTSIVFETESGVQLMIHQVAGFLARRIVCYAKRGQKVTQGDELGFIKFGSRADIFLPLDSKVIVKIGDVVKGGITPIASFD